jgi:hypothetical protein
LGLPRSRMSCSSSRTTRTPLSEVSTTVTHIARCAPYSQSCRRWDLCAQYRLKSLARSAIVAR